MRSETPSQTGSSAVFRALGRSAVRERPIKKRPRAQALWKWRDGPPLNPQQLGAIKEFAEFKLSNGAIAAVLGLKISTVAWNADIVWRGGGGPTKDRRGRPKTFSPRELRQLHKLLEDKPFTSTADICENVNEEKTSTVARWSLRQVSASSVQRAFKGLGLYYCSKAKPPFVSDANKVKRLQRASSHQS